MIKVKKTTDKTKIKFIDGGPAAVIGVTGAGVHCGLKPDKELDAALFLSEKPCKTAAFFTTNKLLGAHIPVFREKLQAGGGLVSALLVNSKNANCSTGKQGERDNIAVSAALAKELGLPAEQVLFASTGVIGVRLPKDKILSGLDALVTQHGKRGMANAARAIMTTDTRPKSCAVEVEQGGRLYHIGGVAKGSGMIAPNLATMFSFVFTDADLPMALLKKIAAECVEESYNSILVDGDMSPNDTVLAMANGMSEVKLAASDEAGLALFKEALGSVMKQLAMEIVRDGEGATKVMHIEVNGAASAADAKCIARAIALSPLVKTAVFGMDPNWGRIISAAGASGAKFDPLRASLLIDGARVFKLGKPQQFKAKIMRKPDVFIQLDAGLGSASARFWSCDLSIDYVKINAEYMT
ncbi:MAG: bifunctional glutamate N-acetyltransferase/amino-acid acetyltransferase ArgJ [bacterium]